MESEKFNILLNKDQLFILGEALRTFVNLHLADFEKVFDDLNDKEDLFLNIYNEDPERYNRANELISVIQKIILGGENMKVSITNECVDYKAKMAFDMAKEVETKLKVIGYIQGAYFGNSIINKASEEDPIVIITKE